MIFKRKLYHKMLQWKNERQGNSALLLKGARRVGKSTLAEEFAKNEYKTYILIDFSHVSKKVSVLFDDMSDLNFFFMHLQIETGVTLYERESVIIFDEVQLQPLARQAIKHLVKDGRYDYIETGSLLSIKKNVQNIVIPSEETRITLYPMDFEEFYWALGNDTTFGILRQFWEKKHPLESSHRKLMRDLRLYMLTGGMPQAVDTYLKTNNMQAVDEKKREIIELYEDDFNKIDNTGRASHLFSSIPSQLTSNAGRYQISSVLKNQDAQRVAEVVSDMEDSMAVMLAYHVNDPIVGMPMTKNISRYKMFLADTGLFVTLAFREKSFTENVIYSKLLSDKLGANLGYIYENLTAQMLRSAGNELFYYTFPAENKHNYEIDFLLSHGNKLCPIEVKSSGYKTHKSLDVFCEKFSSRVGERYLIYTKDFVKDGETTCLPPYMTPFL
ncbi:ATP-binding protein [bacterium]|nr:ATP-binding protein [bacterium]MBR4532765.1 ATP-binding protein [bacterium]